MGATVSSSSLSTLSGEQKEAIVQKVKAKYEVLTTSSEGAALENDTLSDIDLQSALTEYVYIILVFHPNPTTWDFD